MRQVDHEAGIPPRSPFGNAPGLKQDNPRARLQLGQATGGRQPRKAAADHDEIGRALIGKQLEEEVEVTVPSGEKFYLIEKIEFI